MLDALAPSPADQVRKRMDQLARADGAARLIAAADSLAKPSQCLERTLDVEGVGQLDAFRVRFAQGGEPTKGGIRFDADADAHEVERLALLMALKCALSGLPYGGAKGAVKVDARTLDRSQRDQVARAYARAFSDIIGPDTDVPAPDIATGADEMDAIRRELGYEKGASRAPITGLPPEHGGLKLRKGATGLGAWRVYQRLCKEGLCVARPRIAIQGFGNAGKAFAHAACANGAVIVAASDSRSLAHDRDGLDLDALDARKSDTGKVGQSGDPESIFTIDCDVLVLAAKGTSVTSKTAQEIKAGRLVEIANAPVTGEGYQVLDARGIQSLPDILANAGGVVGSYFEWREFARSEQPDNDALQAEWEAVMDAAADRVSARVDQTGLPVHSAALVEALHQLEPGSRQLLVS